MSSSRVSMATRRSIWMTLWVAVIGTIAFPIHAAIAPASSAARSSASTPATGLGQVIAGMAAEGCEKLTTACLLTSRSVTKTEREAFSQQLLGQEEQAVGLAAGNSERALAVTQPITTSEVVTSTLAAAGNLIFCPSTVDLQRGEGLLESLAPAMEVVLREKLQATSSLLVVADDVNLAKEQLARQVESILPTLVKGQKQTLHSLEDIFATVTFVTPSQALETLIKEGKASSTSDAASRIAIASKTALPTARLSSSNRLGAADLAAARTLGPVARKITQDAVQTVRDQCRTQDEMGALAPKRVVDFGQLAEAAMQAAKSELEAAAAALPPSTVAQQLQRDALGRLDFILAADFAQQVELLSEESFEAFRKALSKLIIGPNLASDMQQVASTTSAAFGRQVRRLVAPSVSHTWTTSAAVAAFRARLQDSVTTRLAVARATGKFRPLPRKGVTVGFHWLLPKPFGNDFRQEPWQVHASDNLVYVPASKMTQVDPTQVAAGEDWRTQIVPSPVGNDMVFMQ